MRYGTQADRPVRCYRGADARVIHFGSGPGHLSWSLGDNGVLSALREGSPAQVGGMFQTGPSESTDPPSLFAFEWNWTDPT